MNFAVPLLAALSLVVMLLFKALVIAPYEATW